MARTLLSSGGGTVTLPDLVLNDRRDGGHLIVTPARDVWERSELTFDELAAWSALTAATGWAMYGSPERRFWPVGAEAPNSAASRMRSTCSGGR